MPVYKDEQGNLKKIHAGYEGDKYKEIGTVKDLKWRRAGKIAIGGSIFIYGYMMIAALLEESSASATRDVRRKLLHDRQEQNPEIFREALSRGMITTVDQSGGVQTPLNDKDSKDKFLKQDLNLKYRERISRLD